MFLGRGAVYQDSAPVFFSSLGLFGGRNTLPPTLQLPDAQTTKMKVWQCSATKMGRAGFEPAYEVLSIYKYNSYVSEIILKLSFFLFITLYVIKY